eukprot:Gb_32831 [translate_table: standard]
MAHLKTLKTVTALSLFPNNIQNPINELCAFSVMSLGPVIPSTSLSKHKVIRPEYLPIRTGTHTIHRTRLQIHKHSTRHISTPTGFIIIHIDPLQLQI